MNKPTEEGHYWVRQNYINHSTGEVNIGTEEIVNVCLAFAPHCRNHDKPKILMVFGRFWQERLDKVPDRWQWGQRIVNDLPLTLFNLNFNDCII